MTLQWIVSNFNDPDLVPNNVKNLVKIFDVEGDYQWGVGTLWVWQSQNTYWSIQTMPQYMLAMNKFGSLLSSAHAFVLVWNNLICGIWQTNVTIGNYAMTTFFSIDITTGGIIYIWTMSTNWTPRWFNSIYYDSITNKIYRNYQYYESWYWYQPRHYKLDTITLTITWYFSWHITTWVTLPNNLTVWWKNYSPFPPVSWNWLRTGNSGNDEINRTWILVS